MPSFFRSAHRTLPAGVLAALLGVAGCVQEPLRPVAETASLQQSTATSSIVDFVSKADVGQSGAVDAATVRVVNAYAAASGRTCRQYIITENGRSASHLACSSDHGWVEVRPLILGP